MRVSSTILSCLAVASLTLSPAAAATKPGNAGKPTSVGKPTNVGKPTSVGKPTNAGKPTNVGKPAIVGKPTSAGKPTNVGKPPSAGKPTTGKPTVAGKPLTTGKPAKVTAAPPVTTTKATKAAPGKAAVTTTTTTTTPTLLNPIAAKIASKPNLSAKLTGMLPIDPLTGRTMTLNAASLGFKNQGQFIAALHVSQNLGIPFTELKSHMVTVTPGLPGEPPTATQTGSLGRAIQASKSTVVVTTEVERAEAQAVLDLQAPPTKKPATFGVR